ncbi:MAG: 30S ribosomal protein S5 [Nanoarchaeota archaeon]
MPEQEKIEQIKVIEEVPLGIKKVREFNLDNWNPKTEIGKKVKAGQITGLDEIINSGQKIFETEIVDYLLPNLQTELLLIGQSKGKFGGGKRSIWRQTQKKTSEGNKPKFTTLALVGNKDGYVGIGFGKSKETMPAREKAIRNAKLNVIKVKRGCGSWECGCAKNHSIPFKVEGKSSSVSIRLMPAPKGAGLVVEKECQKILDFAGIKDVFSKTSKSRSKMGLIKACFSALKYLSNVKVKHEHIERLGIK